MFVGHYGPAFAVKAGRKPPSLGAAMVAVQLVDIAWSIFILTGIERARIEPGFLALSPLRLDYMPYTHSLPGALAWSLAGALVYRLLDRRGGWSAAALIGVCVFSHWILDFLVHAPDLPLGFEGPKVGLGLWGNPVLGIGAEALVLFGGFFMYLGATKATGAAGRIAPWAMLALLVALQAYNLLTPPPPDIMAMAPTALAAYLLVPALGFLVDRTRALKVRLQVQS